MQLAKKQRSTKDETTKFLFRLRDGQCIESVLMRYEYGYSLCISSQVGCRMGCRFCASTLGGLVRNLTAGEMVQQVYAASKEASVRISHVVVMGCGEPFDNYDALLRFFSLMREEKGRGLSLRNITVSTCGLPHRIREFADCHVGVTLAVSLHAADDELRRQLMPGAARFSLDELLDACQYYTKETGRRVTFEYALIKGCNDGRDDAVRLVQRLRGMLAHVNLIPVNPVEERGLARSSPQRVREFAKVLEMGRIPVTIRREMGADIDGACGQLRNRYARA